MTRATIPLTRRPAGEARAAEIRAAVRTAEAMPSSGASSRLARPEDAAALHAFFSDPAVHAPIYSLPRPLTEATVRAFIEEHLVLRERGEGLLFISLDEAGAIAGYSDVQIWPDWAAGELAGGLRPDRQSAGRGAAGAMASFDWMFDTLGLELICETAALDNVRTARLLDAMGFERKGEVESTRPDGTVRRSLVWELDRETWRARRTG